MTRRPRMTTLTTVGLAGAILLGPAACSDSGKSASSATTTVAPSTTAAPVSSTSAPTSTSASSGPASTCPAAPGQGIPQGMTSRVMGDVDGDGQADTLYVGVADNGLRRFGLVTATGHRSEWCVGNASPLAPAILGVVDADQDGRAEVFVNPGRLVNVLVFADGRLQPYLNKEGQPYELSIGFGAVGTGVGCIDADGDGHRDLVGLDEKDLGNGKVQWTRTIITLHGTQARNGAKDSGTYTSPADDHAIALLHQVTCGDDTFADPLTAPG